MTSHTTRDNCTIFTENFCQPNSSYEVQQHPLYGHYIDQPVLTGISSQQLEDLAEAMSYCQDALADGI